MCWRMDLFVSVGLGQRLCFNFVPCKGCLFSLISKFNVLNGVRACVRACACVCVCALLNYLLHLVLEELDEEGRREIHGKDLAMLLVVVGGGIYGGGQIPPKNSTLSPPTHTPQKKNQGKNAAGTCLVVLHGVVRHLEEGLHRHRQEEGGDVVELGRRDHLLGLGRRLHGLGGLSGGGFFFFLRRTGSPGPLVVDCWWWGLVVVVGVVVGEEEGLWVNVCIHTYPSMPDPPCVYAHLPDPYIH